MTSVIEPDRLRAAPAADARSFRVARLGPADAGALTAMLGRCSPASLYHRFHGVSDGTAHAAEVVAGHPGQDAYLAWGGDRCVGVASLGDGPDGSTHIGALVEDAWQRRGVGSALIAALVVRAHQRGITTLTADVLFEDRFILTLLRRIGPLRTSAANPGYEALVTLAP